MTRVRTGRSARTCARFGTGAATVLAALAVTPASAGADPAGTETARATNSAGPVAALDVSCPPRLAGCIFDGSASTGPIVSYAWDFDDGHTGNGETTFHRLHRTTSIEDFTITLTVTDASGRTDNATEVVHCIGLFTGACRADD